MLELLGQSPTSPKQFNQTPNLKVFTALLSTILATRLQGQNIGSLIYIGHLRDSTAFISREKRLQPKTLQFIYRSEPGPLGSVELHLYHAPASPRKLDQPTNLSRFAASIRFRRL